MGKLSIKHIAMTNFRNHEVLRRDIKSKFTFIIGRNGVGKTSILEAISLFMPGRGFRARSVSDVIHENISEMQMCQICVGVERGDIICSIDKVRGKKSFKVIGNVDMKHAWLANIIWLCPEMDGMFVDSADERRRFLDSAVYCFMKEHREHCAKYKHYVKSRLHLLKLGDYNDVWMSSIEKSIAQLSVKIDVARSIVVRILSDSMQDIAWEDVCLVMRSSLSSEFGMHDITIEELRKYDDAGFADEIKHVEEQFYFRREKDARSGVSTFGAHRSDFSMMLRGNDVSRCSTGEQKRSLLILIMAKARIIPNVCVLLDDTLAHLDPDMQRSILEMLDKTEAQIFMTSASMEHYECAAKYVRDVDIWRI